MKALSRKKKLRKTRNSKESYNIKFDGKKFDNLRTSSQLFFSFPYRKKWKWLRPIWQMFQLNGINTNKCAVIMVGDAIMDDFVQSWWWDDKMMKNQLAFTEFKSMLLNRIELPWKSFDSHELFVFFFFHNGINAHSQHVDIRILHA